MYNKLRDDFGEFVSMHVRKQNQDICLHKAFENVL